VVKVKVRGGYEFPYRHNLYKSGDVLDMEEGEYRGLAHLFDVVKEPIKEVVVEAPVKGPEITTEDMELQENRAILKPARTRSRK
jgi:hypothetical protein